MERELKFRAWDKYRMIYFSDFSIGLTKGKKIVPYVFFKTDTFNGEVKLGAHKIMQFTGFIDKNGKEIYEDDTISSDFGLGIKGKVQWKQQAGGWWITWIEHKENREIHRYIELAHGEMTGSDVIVLNRIEVTGNIYETKNN